MKASINGPASSYTPKPKSCNRCYELRKKCDMIPEGCAKCVKAGLTCSYDRTALSHGPKRSGISTDAVPSATSESVALSKTPCVRCKTHHRRCGKELPACSSCARMTAVTCVYATQPTPGSSLSEAHQTVAKVDRGPLLSRDTPMTSPDAVLKATSAPAADSAEADSVSFVSSSSSEFCDDSSVALSDNIVSLKSYERHAAAVMEANPKLALTDSDLLPTIQDWALCYRFFSGGKYSLLNFMDGVNFLEGFFFQSPPLRLTWCAIAAYMQQPRLSPETCLAYYNRARKAVTRFIDVPNLKTLQALLLLSFFALSNGQPQVAQPFAYKAVTMIMALGLDLDPDEAPWTISSSMSEYDKEDRRITFWVAYYTIKMLQIAVPKWYPVQHVNIQPTKVKPARKVSTWESIHVPPHNEIAAVCYLSSILDVIHHITRQHFSAPTLPETTPAANAAAAAASLIMSSETCIILRKELIHLGCIIPPHFILTDIASVTAFQAAITSTSQQSQNSMIATLFDTVTISIYFNAATMLLLRPQLYLTSCLPIDHPVLLSNPDNITHLLSTLSSSITAARCITYINSWILHHTAESTNPTPLRHKIWHEHLFSSFPLFEAALVLWFATCRTRLFWWSAGEIAEGPLCMGLAERRRVRGEVLDVLRTLRELTPLFAMVAPLVVCVEGFVADMERVEETLTRGVDLLQGVGRTEDFVEELVIALKTVVVGTTGDDIEYHVEEPWCFLGLLGQEVDGAGVRMMWNSSNEAGWKVFWGQFDG